jgi:hypothetical protein
MYATLSPGAVNRALATADLNVADTDASSACGLHAAEPLASNAVPMAQTFSRGSAAGGPATGLAELAAAGTQTVIFIAVPGAAGRGSSPAATPGVLAPAGVLANAVATAVGGPGSLLVASTPGSGGGDRDGTPEAGEDQSWLPNAAPSEARPADYSAPDTGHSMPESTVQTIGLPVIPTHALPKPEQGGLPTRAVEALFAAQRTDARDLRMPQEGPGSGEDEGSTAAGWACAAALALVLRGEVRDPRSERRLKRVALGS